MLQDFYIRYFVNSVSMILPFAILDFNELDEINLQWDVYYSKDEEKLPRLTLYIGSSISALWHIAGNLSSVLGGSSLVMTPLYKSLEPIIHW